MILAEVDARHEASDKSHASTSAEPTNAGMFTAINRHNEGQGPDSAHTSPTQVYQSLPGDVDLPTHPIGPGHHGDLDIMDNLGEWESSRIADCLGGVGGDIQGFSYGDVPDANLLFGQNVPLMGFGGYT